MKCKKEKKISILDFFNRILWVGIFITVPFFLIEVYKYSKAMEEYNRIPGMSNINISAVKDLQILDKPPDQWPEKSLFIETDRSEYQSGQLQLIIPRMNVWEDVMDGTDASALKCGPGLYTVAQMPGSGRNGNTSIAGHRAGYGHYGNLFKEIHKVTEQDLLYLKDSDKIYVYVYEDTVITDPEDISVLYIKGYPCLTLTSCHPIGSNTERIVLTAKLTDILPYDEAYQYPANLTEIK